MSTDLKDKRIAVLMTDGVEQTEYAEPRQFLEQQGARVTLISTKEKGEDIQGFNHMQPDKRFKVELAVQDAKLFARALRAVNTGSAAPVSHAQSMAPRPRSGVFGNRLSRGHQQR